MKFDLDETELGSCVNCGLCLPHCPTFRVTGEEALSPRGRIAAIRAVHDDDAPVTDEFISFMETCVQCRGCEPACPSGVPYGRLQEGVRKALATQHRITPRRQRLAFAALPRHRLLLTGSTLLAGAQRLRLVPSRFGLPRLPLRRPAPVRATGNAVWLFTGCVMDAWHRDTHRNTAKVLSALGVTFALPNAGGGCCGALHIHAGLADGSRRLANDVIASMPGDRPIIVNSAGCGAALKDYGHLLRTASSAAFSARVIDVNEFVALHLDRLPTRRHLGAVIIQDPCHLRHVQRNHQSVRSILAAIADIVELDDDGLCCGAGGAYSATQPDLAAMMRASKLAAIERAGGGVVASANPGCVMHLAAAGVVVRHPIDLLADTL
ncbi:MAG: 4Fe-4S dicluster domain-containing protein [Actinobacteria bacterium]|nr:4Fe-4S dicluster domain-containing protein [Actinomycetota bacterium]